MKDVLTSDDIYAEIIFLQGAGARTVVLVEGDRDIRALDSHLDSDNGVECIQGHGKPNCLGVMSLVDANKNEGVIAILDRDWSGKITDDISSSNLVLTDAYDLDSTIAFATKSLERVASNFSTTARMRRHLQAGRQTVDSLIVELCAPLGKLRFLSVKHSIGLALSDFPLHVAVRSPGYEIDVDQMIELAIHRTQGCRLTKTQITSKFNLEEFDEVDIYYCSGHDMHRIMAHLIRKRWGGSGGEENIANAIRSTLSRSELEKTELYSRVMSWTAKSRRPTWRHAA